MSKQYSVNRNNIYKNIVSNLNLKTLHVNNGIYKIVQPVTDELENFVEYTNSLLRELDPLTASYNTLVKMGVELGVYRQHYNELQIEASSEIVKLVIDQTNIFTTQNIDSVLLFNKNYNYSLGNYNVIFLTDVYASDSDLTVKIILQANSAISIEEGTLITLTPEVNSDTVSEVQLLFNKTIGLINMKESVDDFRSKIIKAKNSLHFNRNNSIDLAVTEVPGISYIEIDRKDNNSFSNIYIYTDKLLTEGQDPNIYPLLTTAFSYSLNKYLEDIYDYQISSATPFNVSINISSTNNYSEEYLKSSLNQFMTKLKSVTTQDICDYFNTTLSLALKPTDISLALKSDSIFENDLNINPEEVIELPPGRFFCIYNLKKV